ncbi:MAG: helix-turn-helix transcriptional regulator [Burkholderiaceae bacterium]|nr:helix-turn-helix transcriptional regulator [Burkholderiaceae bacterium]
MVRQEHVPEELTDAVYRAALDPRVWREVMQAIGSRFPSEAQTFYLLHMQPRRVQPVSLQGIDLAWVQRFDGLYFLPDNPWMRLTGKLHVPGLVRTNPRLDHLLRTRGALYRSIYYNEWMRPQGLKHTMGNTLMAENGVVANITLMRAPDRPNFSGPDVRCFEDLSRHLTRALQMSMTVQQGAGAVSSTALLDALPQPLAVVDGQRRLLHANEAMQALLRSRSGLELRDGRLRACDAGTERALADALAVVLSTALTAALPSARLTSRARAQTNAQESAQGVAARDSAASWSIPLPQDRGTPLPDAPTRPAARRLTVLPLRGPLGHSLVQAPTALLMVSEERPALPTPDELRARHGCTPSEARLVGWLLRGHDLDDAARRMGIRYGSARNYLKAVFEKTGVHSQAQLVILLLGARG